MYKIKGTLNYPGSLEYTDKETLLEIIEELEKENEEIIEELEKENEELKNKLEKVNNYIKELK